MSQSAIGPIIGTSGGGAAVTLKTWLGGMIDTTSLTTQYVCPVGRQSAGTPSFSTPIVAALAGTIKNLYVVLNAAPGVGITITLTFLKNGVSQTLLVSITGNVATTGSDTTHSFTVAAGDSIIFLQSETALGGLRQLSWGFEFDPS